MQPKRLLTVMCLCAWSWCFTAATLAHEVEPSNPGPSAAPSHTSAAALPDSTNPDDGHKFLGPYVGAWATTTRMWWSGPNGPVTESKGSAEVRWILGGRYLLEESSGEMAGKPRQGMGITGYDTYKKKFVSTWIDNLGTAILRAEGTRSPEDGAIVYYGFRDDPKTGEHDNVVKYVSRMLDPNRRLFEIFDIVGEDSRKVVEITYTRR